MYRAALVTAAVLCAGAPVLSPKHPPSAAARIADAAQAFLDSLPDELRGAATFSFEDAEREKWNFVPGTYDGVTFAAMGLEQRRAAHALLRATLSAQGYLQVTSIFVLERVLFELQSRPDRPATHRDPERYSFAVFGDPSVIGRWGWRIQGHHLSLNVTSVVGELAITPSFLGSNPAEVRDGPYAGLRVLGDKEDLARELLAMLTPEQRGRAVIADDALAVVLVPDKSLDAIGDRAGLPASAMDEVQRKTLRALVECYTSNLHDDLARAELGRIALAGVDDVRFAWAGSTELGEPHYFRVHGPTFVIEYDNTQNDANHVHTVWHDLENGFGRDALRRHYAREHSK